MTSHLRLLLLGCLFGVGDLSAQTVLRYPHELPGYRFYANASWRCLTPLRSTTTDVREALGHPVEEVDLAAYGEPYPGDDAAKSPLFIYDVDADWKLYVYFVGSRGDHPELSALHRERLFSCELLPRAPRLFPTVFSREFVRRKVMAADAGWNEFADGTGLIYAVYTGSTPFGKEKTGDLNRIIYGPAPCEIKQAAGRHWKERLGG